MRAIVIPMLAVISSVAALAQAQPRVMSAGTSADVTVRGTASGDMPASDIMQGCQGYVPDQPDFRFNHTQAPLRQFLRMYTQSDEDLVLVIRRPDGSYLCDDDSGPGLNPAIDDNDPQRGTYDVWVGVFRPETIADYTLTLTSSRNPVDDQ